MGRLNGYLFRTSLINIGALVVFACLVLLLERLLRIFQIVTNSAQPASDASSMIVNLLPHYLGIAVPMALLLGVIITVDRLSRSSEITAAMGAGVSIWHMSRPFFLIAILLAGANIFIEGYMQPIGRYNYRHIVHVVKQQSFTAALREGIFTPVGDRTFFAGTDHSGGSIGPIFIYERLKTDGRQTGIRITSAEEGQLIIRDETLEPVLQLAEGQTYQINNTRQLQGDLSFDSSTIAGTASEYRFRHRGEDERELTSVELFKNRNGSLFPSLNTSVNNSALHLRLARTVLLLLLPFIAVPFGLNYGRNPSSAGIIVGIVFLLSIQKSLEFAQDLGASGEVEPWISLWSVIFAVAIFAFYSFYQSAYRMGQPPLTVLSFWIKDLVDFVRNLIHPPPKNIEDVN